MNKIAEKWKRFREWQKQLFGFKWVRTISYAFISYLSVPFIYITILVASTIVAIIFGILASIFSIGSGKTMLSCEIFAVKAPLSQILCLPLPCH